MKIILVVFITLFLYSNNVVAQNWLWGKEGIVTHGNGIGGTQIAADSYGNVYTAGLFEGTLKFGSYILQSDTLIQNNCTFLAKYNPSGNIIWAKQSKGLNTTNNIGAYDVTVDKNGNSFVTANFTDSIRFGTYILSHPGKSQDFFLVKYDSAGNIGWAKQSHVASSASFVESFSVSSDRNGNSYVAATFQDTITIGTFTLISNSNVHSALICKFDPNGNVLWAKQPVIGATSEIDGYGITNDALGNLYMTGEFNGSVQFGSYNFTAQPNTYDVYVVKYDSNGNTLWAEQSASNTDASCAASSVSKDKFGNVYITGNFDKSVIFGKDTLTSHNNDGDIFIVKYDSKGNEMWAKQSAVLDNGQWTSWSVSAADSDNIYIAACGGDYGDINVVFEKDTFNSYDTSGDEASLFLQIDDSTGNLVCGTIFHGGGDGWADATATDSKGQYVYIAGGIYINSVFGSDTLKTNEYTFYPYVARWNSCDNLQGINEIVSNDMRLNLYPNPNNGIFTISLQNINEEPRINIYNMLGQSIYNNKINHTNTTLNLSGQPTGIYLYRVVSEKGENIGSGKVIIE
ncbi:MAG: T9SS type A sorting domain-containing protein [Bacteroidia bacterium]